MNDQTPANPITTPWTPTPNAPIPVLAAVIEQAGRWLICQRPEGKRHAGLWEFPGGKLEPGESLADAAQRELLEELDVRVDAVGPILFRQRDEGSNFEIIFVAVNIAGDARALEHSDIAWLNHYDILDKALAPSDRAFAMEALHIVAYEAEVSAAMQSLYGITWKDASGEPELLTKALDAGQTPTEFVQSFGERYDLTPIEEGWS